MKYKKYYPAIRRIIFALTAIGLYLVQFIVLPKISLNLPVLLLIPFGVAVSMAEKELPGMLYGLLIGVLWDSASAVTDGLWALFFAAAFLITGLLTRYILRNTLLTSILFTLVITLLYLGIVTAYARNGITAETLPEAFAERWLPAIILTAVSCAPVYAAVKLTANALHPDRDF